MNRYARLRQQPWALLDGAIGTELEKALPAVQLPWSLDGLVGHPELTEQIHARYIASGADVITINGFRTTARTLRQVDWSQLKLEIQRDLCDVLTSNDAIQIEFGLNALAAALATQARNQAGATHVCVAGNLAPLEDCFKPELSPPMEQSYQEHRTKAQALEAANVDLILIETMNSIAEAEGALKAALETQRPVWASFACMNGPTLLSGEPLAWAVERSLALLPGRLDVVMVNCTTPEDVDLILPELSIFLKDTGIRFGAYANIQAPDPQSVWQRRETLTSQDYARHAQRWLDLGAWVVGGCCGTSPTDIALMNDGLAPNRNPRPA